MKKIDFIFLKRNKRGIFFGVTGFLLALILAITFFYLISFLVKKVNLALEVDSQNQPLITFNIEALKSLNLTEELSD